MKYRKKLCPRCPTGLMRIQSSRRGYFYRCDGCSYTINNHVAPESNIQADEFEPVILQFDTASQAS